MIQHIIIGYFGDEFPCIKHAVTHKTEEKVKIKINVNLYSASS